MFEVGGYNSVALAFFSITGAVLQLPIIFAFGFTERPNIPLTIISSWFLYFCISTSITAIAWTGADVESWWSGAGWCDIDVRLYTASSPGILAAQCMFNWEMLDMVRPTPRVLTNAQHRRRSLIVAGIVMSLPVLIFAIDTFITYSRYQVIQYIGCSNNIDHSVAYIMCYVIWLLILGLACLVTMIIFMLRFFSYGKEESFERVTFIPNMSRGQFIRLATFSLVITCILTPLSLYMFSSCVILLKTDGTTSLAWVRGKPDGWDQLQLITFLELRKAFEQDSQALNSVIGNNMAVKIILVALSWILFLCFGTSSFALMKYRRTLTWLGLTYEGEKSEEPSEGGIETFDEFSADSSKEAPFRIRQLQLPSQNPADPTYQVGRITGMGTLLASSNILCAPSKI